MVKNFSVSSEKSKRKPEGTATEIAKPYNHPVSEKLLKRIDELAISGMIDTT